MMEVMIDESAKGETAMKDLKSVPNDVLDRRGAPRFGTYRGEFPVVDYERLSVPERPRWWHWLARRKRWHYTIACTDEVLVGHAVVDGAYFVQSFIYVVDLYEERAILNRAFTGLPARQGAVNKRPGMGHHSWFRIPGVRFDLSRREGNASYRWEGEVHPFLQGERQGMSLEATIAVGEAPALSVVSPVSGGGMVNTTQKWVGLPLSGYLRVGSRSYRLDGGTAGVDYTHGLLDRRTAWRWALAMGRLSDGRRVGLNLVEGFNDGDDDISENGLWVGDRFIGLGRAVFEYDRDKPEDEWRVRTEDGQVDLRFESSHVYRDLRNWGFVDCYFVQPAGRFQGRLQIDGEDHWVELTGVTEDQDICW